MSLDLPAEFPPGTELTGQLVETILRELWRWRHADAAAPLLISDADSAAPPTFVYLADPDVFWADSGSGFAAASRSSPSSATVNLLAPDATGALTASAGSLDGVLSPWSKAIAASKLIVIKRISGFWYVIAADC